jgi:hypothetical protein
MDLHSYLNPETFYFRVDVVGGKVELVQESAPPSIRPFHLTIDDTSSLQRYSATDILVLETFPRVGNITKVLANGKEVCCKIATTTHGYAVQREYERLQTILLSKYADSIQVPKLLAFIVDDYGVIGILEEFIPSKCTLGKMLTDAVAPNAERRYKWAQQIKQSIHQLHEIGVVWGDGKTEYILINSETDDAWLIDFGGSFTEGWVDAELKETIDGDEQALTKIIKALNIG